MTKGMDFIERIAELIKDDKELHDATVRLLDALTEVQKEQVIRMIKKRTTGNLK
jgi:hypothetical protein